MQQRDRHYRKSGLGAIGRSGVTLIELVVVATVVLGMILALTPFVKMVRARAQKIRCADRLRQISIGLHRYAADHEGVFPPNLGVLYPDYIEDEKAFDCPAAKGIGTKDQPDYKYTAGLTTQSSPKEVMAQDLEGSHKKLGKNILRSNGSIEWLGSQR